MSIGLLGCLFKPGQGRYIVPIFDPISMSGKDTAPPRIRISGSGYPDTDIQIWNLHPKIWIWISGSGYPDLDIQLDLDLQIRISGSDIAVI